MDSFDRRSVVHAGTSFSRLAKPSYVLNTRGDRGGDRLRRRSPRSSPRPIAATIA